MAEVRVTRLASLTQEIVAAMRISFDGMPSREVARRVEMAELAILCAEFPEGTAYAIMSMNDGGACIEALEGACGTVFTRMIVDHARAQGIPCEAWVLSESRVRLAKRAGLFPTGAERKSYSGRPQLQVKS